MCVSPWIHCTPKTHSRFEGHMNLTDLQTVSNSKGAIDTCFLHGAKRLSCWVDLVKELVHLGPTSGAGSPHPSEPSRCSVSVNSLASEVSVTRYISQTTQVVSGFLGMPNLYTRFEFERHPDSVCK